MPLELNAWSLSAWQYAAHALREEAVETPAVRQKVVQLLWFAVRMFAGSAACPHLLFFVPTKEQSHFPAAMVHSPVPYSHQSDWAPSSTPAAILAHSRPPFVYAIGESSPSSEVWLLA